MRPEGSTAIQTLPSPQQAEALVDALMLGNAPDLRKPSGRIDAGAIASALGMSLPEMVSGSGILLLSTDVTIDFE